MYFDFMPGDLMGGDNIFDFEYSCVIVRAVWNVRCRRYDTLFYGGLRHFDVDEKSIIWVNDFHRLFVSRIYPFVKNYVFKSLGFFRMLVVNPSVSGVAYEY